MVEYPYNMPPLRPVHGEVYDSASQRGEFDPEPEQSSPLRVAMCC
jgi:hypothetical protein